MTRSRKTLFCVSVVISIFPWRSSAVVDEYATATESCEELAPTNTWEDATSPEDCVNAHLALNDRYANKVNDYSGNDAAYWDAPCGCTYHLGFNQIHWWGNEGSGCSATNKCENFRNIDDNDVYCFCKRKAAPTISPAPTPSIPETAAPNNFNYNCTDRNTCCYLPCDQIELSGDQKQFEQISNCGAYCTEDMVPDLNGVLHPELYLMWDSYYTNSENYSYDDTDGPMTIEGSEKNMFDRCYSQCFPGETFRPTPLPTTDRPTPSPNNDPACLTKCGASTYCDADNVSRFLFAGQSNMEGNPEDANPGLFNDLLRILNTKGKNKKWKLDEMKKEIMDGKCPEISASENEARFMFKLRKFMKKEGRRAITRQNKRVLCSFTHPEKLWLDCERPMTPRACGKPFGPDLMFAQRFPKLKSPLKNKKIGVIKVAAGGTEIYYHWMKDSGIHWPKLKDAITAAKGSIEAFVWFQGENDSFDDWNQENYLEHLTEFVADVRNEIFITSEKFQSAEDVPVVIVELGAWRRGTLVIEAQQTFVKNTKNTKLVKTGADEDESKRMTDCYHFDSASMLIIGSRVAKAVAKLLSQAEK